MGAGRLEDALALLGRKPAPELEGRDRDADRIGGADPGHGSILAQQNRLGRLVVRPVPAVAAVVGAVSGLALLVLVAVAGRGVRIGWRGRLGVWRWLGVWWGE